MPSGGVFADRERTGTLALMATGSPYSVTSGERPHSRKVSTGASGFVICGVRVCACVCVRANEDSFWGWEVYRQRQRFLFFGANVENLQSHTIQLKMQKTKDKGTAFFSEIFHDETFRKQKSNWQWQWQQRHQRRTEKETVSDSKWIWKGTCHIGQGPWLCNSRSVRNGVNMKTGHALAGCDPVCTHVTYFWILMGIPTGRFSPRPLSQNLTLGRFAWESRVARAAWVWENWMHIKERPRNESLTPCFAQLPTRHGIWIRCIKFYISVEKGNWIYFLCFYRCSLSFGFEWDLSLSLGHFHRKTTFLKTVVTKWVLDVTQ